jgi:hypothetical protein
LKPEEIQLLVHNLLGEVIWSGNVKLTAGENEVQVPSPARGIFLVEVKGQSLLHTEKLFF